MNFSEIWILKLYQSSLPISQTGDEVQVNLVSQSDLKFCQGSRFQLGCSREGRMNQLWPSLNGLSAIYLDKMHFCILILEMTFPTLLYFLWPKHKVKRNPHIQICIPVKLFTIIHWLFDCFADWFFFFFPLVHSSWDLMTKRNTDLQTI